MYRLYMQDPYTEGTIHDADDEFVTKVSFDFYSEDREEWYDLALEALSKEGWTVIAALEDGFVLA